MLQYVSIMLYAFHALLCQKLQVCQHNRRKPNQGPTIA